MVGVKKGAMTLCVLAGMAIQPAAHAVVNNNQAMATFKATILPGTCAVSLDSKKSTIDLQSVSSGVATVLNKPLLTSDGDPQALDISCTGYPANTSMPSLTVTGTNIATSGPGLFRDAGTNPSVSLGFKVQAGNIGAPPADWSNVAYMEKDKSVPVATVTGGDVNGEKIPIRFTMWCVPATGKSAADCQSGGSVTATVAFTFDYE